MFCIWGRIHYEYGPDPLERRGSAGFLRIPISPGCKEGPPAVGLVDYCDLEELVFLLVIGANANIYSSRTRPRTPVGMLHFPGER